MRYLNKNDNPYLIHNPFLITLKTILENDTKLGKVIRHKVDYLFKNKKLNGVDNYYRNMLRILRVIYNKKSNSKFSISTKIF